MSLASAMNTALTGLNASETEIGVVGNNMANANTVGFKASAVDFATQFLQTQSVGSAPTAAEGGTNPEQEGLGVEVAEITPNFTQGTVSTATSSTDLAIQGQGFFIVQGQNDQDNYTRNGAFSTNAQNQLVTSTGNRLLGYGVNDQFEIDTSQLQPLSIPLGTAMVAKATTEATLQGSLTPVGDIANTAAISQSDALTDENITYPYANGGAPFQASIVQGQAGQLTGDYNYYVTYYNSATNTESRPQLVPVPSGTLSSNEISLSNLPNPGGTWTDVRIYRDTTDVPGDTNYYEIGDVPVATLNTVPNYAFVDDFPDDEIRNSSDTLVAPDPNSVSVTGGQVLNFSGPPVTSSTLLTNVVQYDPSSGTYSNPFPLPAATAANPNPTATLTFTGSKGGSTLTPQTFTITSTSTLGQLAAFLQDSLGIQSPPGSDPTNPIPDDSGTGQAAGVSITAAGRIQIVSDDGVLEAASIGLSALQLTSGNPPTTNNVDLPFDSTQSAVGQGAMTSMVAYDSLGTALSVNITAVLQSVSSTATTYRWYADCGQNDPGNGQQQGIAVGTGLISFDGQGNLASSTNTTVSIGRANEPSVKPLQFNLDFSQVSGLAASTASLSVASQDGSAPGLLNSFNISDSGLISGVFSNGISQNLGQIQLAGFANPIGLDQVGQNMYATGVNSGLPILANPGETGMGTIQTGSLEMSNTDIGGSLIDLINASTMYQANSRIITTATQLFDTLLQLGR